MNIQTEPEGSLSWRTRRRKKKEGGRFMSKKSFVACVEAAIGRSRWPCIDISLTYMGSVASVSEWGTARNICYIWCFHISDVGNKNKLWAQRMSPLFSPQSGERKREEKKTAKPQKQQEQQRAEINQIESKPTRQSLDLSQQRQKDRWWKREQR